MNATELQARYPENLILTNGEQHASVMVFVPSFYLDEVIDGASHTLHPAFFKNDTPQKGIYISKFQNVVIDGCAYSLPDLDPATGIDFDTAARACANTASGAHLITAMEWGALALWCQKNDCLPYGNNGFGKDVREETVCAKISFVDQVQQICRTATGTGPVTWSHNRKTDGIYDLNGNVWEWNGGFRLVHGEMQVWIDTISVCGQEAYAPTSPAWRALDGTTGEWICPNGFGTTPNSVKLDYVRGAWQYVSAPLSSMEDQIRFAPFWETTAHPSVCQKAKEQLWALGFLPWSNRGIDHEIALYANNGAAERMAFRGGRWGQGLNAGLFKACIDDPRSYTGVAVGFRSAYYHNV